MSYPSELERFRQFKISSGLDEESAKFEFHFPGFQSREYECIIGSKSDFVDDSLKGAESIVLRELSHGETIRLGRKLIGSLSYGVSKRCIGSILLLAFQLMRPENGTSVRVFPTHDELGKVSDVDYSGLDDKVRETHGTYTLPRELGDEQALAQGYAFLAASMLRMFTKSADNYVRSWTHIVDGYRRFYHAACPIITDVRPVTSVIKSIHEEFADRGLLKNTLYRYLYNANREGRVLELQKYLYDTHLVYTGLHAVSICDRICMTMNCTPETLISVIKKNQYKPQIKGLTTLINLEPLIRGLTAAFNLMKSRDDDHKRQMWKYARLFDSGFLKVLHTKTRANFVYYLGCVLKRVDPSSAGILDIKQLDVVSWEDRDKIWDDSCVLLDEIKRGVLMENQEPGKGSESSSSSSSY